MVEDGSIDFVFSFDSLVHVEADVLDAYLDQLARKLTPDGVGFIHHSNMGRALRPASRARPRACPRASARPLVAAACSSTSTPGGPRASPPSGSPRSARRPDSRASRRSGSPGSTAAT